MMTVSGRSPDGSGYSPEVEPQASPAKPSIPNAAAAAAIIQRIANVANDVAWQAGVGGMETAGSIVSFLAKNPSYVEDFIDGGSVLDWPFRWHVEGCLSWHGQDGKIHHPPASAIEAATAGETAQHGSTVGESAVPQADAQTPSHDPS